MTITTTIRISESRFNTVKSIAKSNGVFISKVIDNALDNYIKNYNEELSKQKDTSWINSLLTK